MAALLDTSDMSGCRRWLLPSGGVGGEVLDVTEQGDLDEGQLTVLAALDTSNLQGW